VVIDELKKNSIFKGIPMSVTSFQQGRKMPNSFKRLKMMFPLACLG
jgi:hypothetical protein